MRKVVILVVLFAELFFASACSDSRNPSMQPALDFCYTLEFPVKIYPYLKGKISSDSICNSYHNKAILIDFTLNNGIIVEANETIFEFNFIGQLKSRKKNKESQISKLLIGMNVRQLNIIEDDLNGSFDSVLDGNKLYRQCSKNENR